MIVHGRGWLSTRMLARGYFGKVIIRRSCVVLGEIDPQGHASCHAEATVASCISFDCIIDEVGSTSPARLFGILTLASSCDVLRDDNTPM